MRRGDKQRKYETNQGRAGNKKHGKNTSRNKRHRKNHDSVLSHNVSILMLSYSPTQHQHEKIIYIMFYPLL